MKNVAIILAAGSGERFAEHLPKQFRQVAGRSIIEICLQRFQEHRSIDDIVLVCPAAHLPLVDKILAAGSFAKVKNILAGGATRQESSFIGVQSVANTVKNVLIHDVARALVSRDVISRVLTALKKVAAVLPAIPATDTIVTLGRNRYLSAIPDRKCIWQAQTPQGFRLDVIRKAHTLAQADGFISASDDCSLVLHYKISPVITVLGDPANIKITYPQDLIIAETLLRK